VLISWKIGNNPIQDSLWTGNLSSCSHEVFSLPDSQLIQAGLYDTVTVWCTLPNGETDLETSADTIVNLKGMHGSYSIGATNSDFTSLSSAIERLNYSGICDTVVFEFEDGTYYDDVVIKGDFLGANIHPLVFTSKSRDSSKVILKNDITSEYFSFRAISNIFINHLSFVGSPVANNSTSINFFGDISIVSIKNCSFNGGLSNPRYFGIRNTYLSSGQRFKSAQIDNNMFNNVYYAVYISNSSLNTDIFISNNEIDSAYIGINLTNQSRCRISNNKLSNITNTGIYLSKAIGTLHIFNNIIECNGRGLYINDHSGPILNPSLIYNNYMFSNSSSGNGIYLRYASDIFIANNSLNYPNSQYQNALRVLYSTAVYNYNNIFANADGRCVSVDSTSLIYSDNNCYFTADSYDYPYDKYSFPYDLEQRKNEGYYDLLSIDNDPMFSSDSLPFLCNANLDGAAVSLPFVTHDLLGNLRDTANPDIGALEFDGFTPPTNLLDDNYYSCDSLEIIPQINNTLFNILWNDSTKANSLSLNESQLFHIQVIDTQCGSEFLDTANFIVYPNDRFSFPVIPSNCDSNTYVLDPSHKFSNITWMNGTTNNSVMLDSTKDVFFNYTDSFGCSKYSDTANFIIDYTPQIELGNDTTITTLDTLILDAGFGDNYIYNWSNFFTPQTIQIIAKNKGVGSHRYSVLVKSKYNCRIRDTINVTIEELTSQNSLLLSSVQVYPNPVSGDKIHILGLNNASIDLTNSIGKTVEVQQDKSDNQIILNTSELNSGMYYLRIFQESEVIVVPIAIL
jgi:hypothetical protein